MVKAHALAHAGNDSSHRRFYLHCGACIERSRRPSNDYAVGQDIARDAAVYLAHRNDGRNDRCDLAADHGLQRIQKLRSTYDRVDAGMRMRCV